MSPQAGAGAASILGGAAFVPTDVGGAVLWLRADKGVTTDGSGNVSAWADQSGNGHNYSQGTPGDRPVFNATDAVFGGRPSIERAATAAWLEGVVANAGSAADIFIRCATTIPNADANSAPSYFGSGTATVNTYTFSDQNFYLGWGSTVRQATGPYGPDLQVDHFTNVTSLNGEWTLRVDGSQHFTTATNTFAWDQNLVDLFSGATGASQGGWLGKIYEVIVYDNKLSANDRATIEEYLAA